MTKPKPKAPAKKPVKKAPVKKVVKASVVEMVSYAMKMVIPTGQYANIQPEIVVKAGDPEVAHKFLAKHMNKLWKEYYLVNERRPEPSPVALTPPPVVVSPTPAQKAAAGQPVVTATTPPKVEATTTTAPPVLEPLVVPEPPPSSVALVKATQAIESCMSNEALELIMAQVEKSVKLTEEDKTQLIPLLAEKSKLLNTPKQ